MASVYVLLVADAAAQPIRALRDAWDTDTLAFLTGARLLSDPAHLYDPAAQHVAQVAVAGTHVTNGATQVFASLPPVALVFRPLASLDLRSAAAAFSTVVLASLIGACVLMYRRGVQSGLRSTDAMDITVLSMLALPSAWGVALGQWSALLLIVVFASLRALKREREVASGLLLSLMLVKPQLVWLAPPVLLLGTRWRMVAGFLLGCAAWMAASLVLVGVSGLVAWVQLLEAGTVLHGPAVGLPETLSSLTGRPHLLIPFTVAATAVALACMVARRSVLRDPSTLMAVAVLASMICSPHVVAEDLVLLGPALVILATRNVGLAMVGAGALSVTYLADTSTQAGAAYAEAILLCLVAAAVLLLPAGQAPPAVSTRPVAPRAEWPPRYRWQR